MRYFPLFADLRGQRVLVVGGGAVAERKVRLLLEAGACVDLVAPGLTDSLQTLLPSPAVEYHRTSSTEQARPSGGEGSIAWIAREFQLAQLVGAAIVVAATSDPAVNARVAAAARERQVLVNVVDDAELSSFIVPAIVDRSPLVIAISSGGVAPVLARHIRERLESLLDESLGGLADLLQRWRGRIKCVLPDLDARRRFYAEVVRGPVGANLRRRRASAAESALAELLDQPQRPAPGSVALVGAGPGDPGLLTLNALRALQDADVILHDRLVSREVLALARRDAERIAVGKSARAHSVPQQRIHQLMLEHARAGRRVVRLKGGDPFVFGRGGEELEFLAANGVPFEVVPGITAALACGAYAGVPLTHRDHAQSLRLVTAHCGESIDMLDWVALAQERQTVAFYMGVAGLATIRERLLRHRRDPATPVAIIENGSRTEQRVTLANLDALEDLALRGGVESPALLIVGEVAALAGRLHWFGAAPRLWESLRRVA